MSLLAAPEVFAVAHRAGARPRSAAALRAASAALARLARRVESRAFAEQRDAARRAAAARPALPRVEFHAEAGAPEGALFVDGHLVGHLPVARL